MMIIIYGSCNQLTSKFQFDPHQLWDAFTFVCEGIDFACPSVLACDIDVSDHLLVQSPSTASTLRTVLARITFDCPCQDAVSTQLTGSEHANARDAIGRRHRMAKDPGPILPDDRGDRDVSF